MEADYWKEMWELKAMIYNLTSITLCSNLATLVFSEIPACPLKPAKRVHSDLKSIRKTKMARVFNGYINGTTGIAMWASTMLTNSKKTNRIMVIGMEHRYINRSHFQKDKFHLTLNALHDNSQIMKRQLQEDPRHDGPADGTGGTGVGISRRVEDQPPLHEDVSDGAGNQIP